MKNTCFLFVYLLIHFSFVQQLPSLLCICFTSTFLRFVFSLLFFLLYPWHFPFLYFSYLLQSYLSSSSSSFPYFYCTILHYLVSPLYSSIYSTLVIFIPLFLHFYFYLPLSLCFLSPILHPLSSPAHVYLSFLLRPLLSRIVLNLLLPLLLIISHFSWHSVLSMLLLIIRYSLNLLKISWLRFFRKHLGIKTRMSRISKKCRPSILGI